MHPDLQSQSKEGDRMEEIKLSDIDVAALLIKSLFEEKMINERTAQKALEKLKELRSRKNAA